MLKSNVCCIKRAFGFGLKYNNNYSFRRGPSRDSRRFGEVSDAQQSAALGMRGPAEPRGPGVHILVPRQPDDQLRHRPGSERHV